MNASFTISAFTRAVGSAMPTISRSLEEIKSAAQLEDVELAACRGGLTDYGTEAEIKQTCASARKTAVNRGLAAVAQMREALKKVREDACEFDADDAARVAPALAIVGLSDDDLRNLAAQYRHSRAALLAISQQGGAFAGRLAAALDGYAEAVSEACRKAGDFAARALTGQSCIKSGNLLDLYITDLKDDIKAAWDALQSTVDGDQAAVDPFEAALKRGAARKG